MKSIKMIISFLIVIKFRFLASSNAAPMFDKAVADLKKLKNEPDDDLKLQLYGLFKQVFN
jgi:hypothetical protein